MAKAWLEVLIFEWPTKSRTNKIRRFVMTSFLVTDEYKAKLSDKFWELQRRFREGSLNPEQVLVALQLIIEGGTSQAVDGLRVGWQRFYQGVFGLEIDLSQVEIPRQPSGFGRLIVVAKSLKVSEVLEACCNRFPVYCYWDNPDQQISENDRQSEKTYAIWVRDRVEADEELKGRSANQLKDANITTQTLLERLLHELKYWSETGEEHSGQHLDVQNWTLCGGSRVRLGNVPRVRWFGDELRVRWCSPGAADSYLRGRAVAVSS